MRHAAIRGVEYALPPGVLDNEQLAAEFKDWTAEKIFAKTGIRERHIAGPEQCASDLGFEAATKLLDTGLCDRGSIDFLLYCSQTPDYFLPTTACVLQHRLQLSPACGALDYNLGCSGYVYGLGLAKGLIESGQANHVLLVTADTYSKTIHPQDKSVRTIFGDAGTATLVSAVEAPAPALGPFVYGTDGAGAKNLIIPTGGFRTAPVAAAPLLADGSGNARTVNNLYMNGSEIFAFTLRVVPEMVQQVLGKAGLTLADIDLCVFHQANKFMLDHLQKKLGVPGERFFVDMADVGNTVSSTIPIALQRARAAGRIRPGSRLLLAGFGVGYSWGAALVQWDGPSS